MKRTIACLLLTAAALSLSACSTGSTGSKDDSPAEFTPKLDTQTDCTLTVAGHYNNFEALEEEFNRFSVYYPNVKLNYTFMDGYSKSDSGILSTALSGNEAPDIFFTYPWISDWKDADVIFEASENLADPALEIDLSCIRSNLLPQHDDGTVLSVPIYTTTYGMMVNEDLFEKENIAVPQTYSGLIDACAAFQEKGYADPIMGYDRGADLLYPMFYPYFCAQIHGNQTALDALNAMEPDAGQYMRSSLELAADFMSHGFIDLEHCEALEDNYAAVIMRFFEGDVPMMLDSGNTVSGTEKRESNSEAITAHPFRYSFYPVPSTEEGGYFINTVSVGFGVNKNSSELAMANEFMRFLVNADELSRMANAKRMVTPCTDMSLNSVYAPFKDIDPQRIINLSELGLADAPASQVSKAGWQVCNGLLTVDEAVAAFGTLE